MDLKGTFIQSRSKVYDNEKVDPPSKLFEQMFDARLWNGKKISSMNACHSIERI